jgi:hypothetical protein
MRNRLLWSILVVEKNREKMCQSGQPTFCSYRAVEKLIMQALLFAVCAIGIPSVCGAQAATGLWANVSTLQSGQKIQVVKMNANKESGTVVSVSDEAIVLHEKSGEHTVQKQDIRVVKLMRTRHRLRNALIGAAVGGGVGAGVGAAAFHPCTGECIGAPGRGGTSAVGGVVGIIGGAVTGALWPNHEIIYRVDGGMS